MSYDLFMFPKPADGEDALGWTESEEGTKLTDPGLQASFASIGVTMADEGYEYMEHAAFTQLVHQANGVVIDFADDGAIVNIAYWHKGAAAAGVMSSVRGVIELIQAATGWVVFDPQLGHEVSDLDSLISSGAESMSATKDMIDRTIAKETTKAPWWRFWDR